MFIFIYFGVYTVKLIYIFLFIFLDGFTSFRDAFPEWCEDDNSNTESQAHRGTGPTDQLMGLRYYNCYFCLYDCLEC